MSNPGTYPPISDYAPIGDCRTMALVTRDAAIEWWCQPRFDAPSVFGAILDRERGGFWRLDPADGRDPLEPVSRRYLPHSGVLETRLRASGSTVSVTDFLAVVGHRTDDPGPAPLARRKLVRLVRCLRGTARLTVRCAPRPDYGARRPRLFLAGPPDRRRRTLAMPTDRDRRVLLGSTADWGPIRHGEATVEVSLAPGEELGLVCDYGPSDTRPDRSAEPGHSSRLRRVYELDELHGWLEETLTFWRDWTAVSTYAGPYRELVERSAITLKLLTYHPSGAIVAAGTTSLPEQIGGGRNWDYRYTWLRDASFTLYALHRLGYRAEADAFMEWVHNAGRSHAGPLVLYRVDGNPPLRERQLNHLEGYRSSRPVRVGNAATWQRQLDIYGEALDAAYLDVRAGHRLTDEEWERFRDYADMAAERWRHPDNSIWEVRGGRRHFTYSKVMCWVAVDRAVRLVEMLGREEAERERVDRWRRAADQIRRAVMTRGLRGDGAFAQSYGSDVMDASALIFPLVGFIRADSPAAEATLRAVQRELAHDGLVLRYRSNSAVDGLSGREGAFLICSFWLADNLALRGELAEAKRLFEHLASHANDVGVFSEEWDATTAEALGNVPQAFTHIALISTAHNLERAAAGQMSGRVRRDAPSA